MSVLSLGVIEFWSENRKTNHITLLLLLCGRRNEATRSDYNRHPIFLFWTALNRKKMHLAPENVKDDSVFFLFFQQIDVHKLSSGSGTADENARTRSSTAILRPILKQKLFIHFKIWPTFRSITYPDFKNIPLYFL